MSLDTDITTTGNLPPAATTAHAMPLSPRPIDAALLIGLALSFVRQGRGGAVPAPLLLHLTTLVETGDPTSFLVSRWLQQCSQRRRPQQTSIGTTAAIIAAAQNRGGL